MEIRHRREHHPVGQGLFHSGSLTVDGRPPFTWVYDCGAMRGSQVAPQVDEFLARMRKEGRTLDAIFLSHFHEDHFNGIARLVDPMTGLTPTRIFLPVLDDVERLIAISASGTSAGPLVTSYLVGGSTGLAEALGVQGTQVIPVAPVGQGGAGGVEAQDFAPDDLPWVEATDGGEALQVALTPSSQGAALTEEGPDGLAFDDQELVVGIDGSILWEFRLHIEPSIQAVRPAFLAALSLDPRITGHLVPGQTVEQWLGNTDTRRSVFTDAEIGEAVEAAYRTIAKNLNLTSLSVYSGPGPALGGAALPIVWQSPARRRTDAPDRIAWLGTGDGRFAKAAAVEAFAAHIGAARLARVRTLVVPHHGGSSDFSDHLAGKLAGANAVFSYGVTNTYGHPSQVALDQATGAGMLPVHVTN